MTSATRSRPQSTLTRQRWPPAPAQAVAEQDVAPPKATIAQAQGCLEPATTKRLAPRASCTALEESATRTCAERRVPAGAASKTNKTACSAAKSSAEDAINT